MAYGVFLFVERLSWMETVACKFVFFFLSTLNPPLLLSEFLKVISYQSPVSVCHQMTSLSFLLQKTAQLSNVRKCLFDLTG